MSESIVNFRVETDLKKAFELAAKSQDRTSSQLLRDFMRWTVEDYMSKNAQRELLTTKKEVTKPKTTKQSKKQPKGSGNSLFDGLMKKGGL